jgi:hypothetical protein
MTMPGLEVSIWNGTQHYSACACIAKMRLSMGFPLFAEKAQCGFVEGEVVLDRWNSNLCNSAVSLKRFTYHLPLLPFPNAPQTSLPIKFRMPSWMPALLEMNCPALLAKLAARPVWL